MTRIAAIAAAAMLAGIGVAAAQTSTTTGKCWDSATNTVRNQTTSTTSGSTTTTTTGSGSTSSTSTTPGMGSTSSTSRPAEAAGLPDCH